MAADPEVCIIIAANLEVHTESHPVKLLRFKNSFSIQSCSSLPQVWVQPFVWSDL